MCPSSCSVSFLLWTQISNFGHFGHFDFGHKSTQKPWPMPQLWYFTLATSPHICGTINKMTVCGYSSTCRHTSTRIETHFYYFKASLLENSLFQHAPTNTPPHVCSTNAMGLRAQCPSSMPIGRYYDRPPAVSEAFLWCFSYPQHVLQRENRQKFGRSKAIIFQKEARYGPNDGCSIKGMHMGV